MRISLLSPLFVLGLSACPEPIPVDENSTSQPSPVQGEQVDPAMGPGTNVVGAPAAAGGQGGPLSAGTFGDIIPESELSAKFSQDELADGFTLSGDLACGDCSGQLLVRLLPPPPQPGAGSDSTAAGDIQLVTIKVFEGTGPFELKAPKEGTVVLQVVDDANSDGKPSSGERMGMSEAGPVTLDGDKTGISLEVGVFPAMPEMDAMGNPLAGSQEGPSNPEAPAEQPGTPEGPPPEGAGGGTPPDGPPPEGAPEGGE